MPWVPEAPAKPPDSFSLGGVTGGTPPSPAPAGPGSISPAPAPASPASLGITAIPWFDQLYDLQKSEREHQIRVGTAGITAMKQRVGRDWGTADKRLTADRNVAGRALGASLGGRNMGIGGVRLGQVAKLDQATRRRRDDLSTKAEDATSDLIHQQNILNLQGTSDNMLSLLRSMNASAQGMIGRI